MTRSLTQAVGVAAASIVLLGAAGEQAWAESTQEAADKLDQANERIRVLEAKYEALLRRVEEMEKQKAKADLDRREFQKMLDRIVKETSTNPVWQSKFEGLKLKLYGYIKADATYTTARTDDVNRTMYVKPEPHGVEDDDEFGMTARQTRLGLEIAAGKPVVGADTKGVLEIDFYGLGEDNKAEPMMRKAYVDLYWKESDTHFIAGQNAEILSPLNPDTLDYPVLWFVGNIGYRRPLFAVSRGLPIDGDTKLTLEAAAVRQTTLDHLGVSGDESRDAGWPVIESRAAFDLASWVPGERMIFGVSGHYGEDEVDVEASDAGGKHYETWSVVADVTLPMTSWAVVKGEVFTGENLDGFLGGIGQGVDLIRDTTIQSTGGWIQLTIYPKVLLATRGDRKDLWLNFGYGIDDPADTDLSAGKRSRNEAIFTNVQYKLSEQVTIGCEVSYWETDYIDTEEGNSLRVQTSVIYAF